MNPSTRTRILQAMFLLSIGALLWMVYDIAHRLTSLESRLSALESRQSDLPTKDAGMPKR